MGKLNAVWYQKLAHDLHIYLSIHVFPQNNTVMQNHVYSDYFAHFRYDLLTLVDFSARTRGSKPSGGWRHRGRKIAARGGMVSSQSYGTAG